MIDDKKYLNRDGSTPEWFAEFKRVQQYIEDALDYNAGMYEIDDVADAIATGEMQLFSGKESAIVSQIMIFPKKKVLHLPFVGGNMKELELMAPSIVEFGKFMNCNMITSAGRRGWDRSFLVRDYGFKPMHSALFMEI